MKFSLVLLHLKNVPACVSQTIFDAVIYFIEKGFVLFEVEWIQIEVILLVAKGFLVEKCGDDVDQLLGLLVVYVYLLLHETGHVGPLWQFQVFDEPEIWYQRFDGNREARKWDLSDGVIFDEATLETADVVRLDAEGVVVLQALVPDAGLVFLHFDYHWLDSHLSCTFSLRPGLLSF